MKYLFLPSLRNLQVDKVEFGEKYVLPDQSRTKNSTLSSLTIGSLSLENMRRLLQWTVCLEDLRWHSPEWPEKVHGWEATESHHSSTSRADIISPRELGEAILTALGTLKILRLGPVASNPHDGSRLDLSTARCLKRMHLPAELIFPPQGSHASRRGLYSLLPASIECIEVRNSRCILHFHCIPDTAFRTLITCSSDNHQKR